LDNVQFEKNYFQNRNRIRTKDGWMWLTIPVITSGRPKQKIMEVEIDNSQKWGNKHWKSIYFNYKDAKFFKDYSEFFQTLYKKTWNKLVDLNTTIIKYLINALGIEVELVKASELGVKGKSTDLLLGICKKIGADTYLSGRFGKNYLDESKFKHEGIDLIYHNFHHPTYKQLFEPFIPQMSIIDLLFNHGKNSLSVIK
jgi:hypothetical protein